MYKIKGDIWELFQEYDILCIPFITVMDALGRPIVKENSFFQESINVFNKLYLNFIKLMRNDNDLLAQVLISTDKQKVLLSFPASGTITLFREKDVVIESAKKLKVYIDNNFNDYFRVLIPPLDYQKMNGYLSEIISELDKILDYRFTMVMPEGYNE